MPFDQATKTLDLWISEGLRNVRFSGGEPSLYPGLDILVNRCKEGGVERIALSTNGTAPLAIYLRLAEVGVNDFSVSLDGGCCAVGTNMTGGVNGAWEKAVEAIRLLSTMTYVTVGMVFTEANIDQCIDAVLFVDSLGVSDIRVIPAAQYNKALASLSCLPDNVLDKYPILKYRIKNLNDGRHVRGICDDNCRKCWLALDDMAVAGKWHFPCIIHLREGGDPIGEIGPDTRMDRLEWILRHDSSDDPICRANCLDVCVDYNDRASLTKGS
jgi:sulfatase maturation enzyme AslB (radical SAM superfamily)